VFTDITRAASLWEFNAAAMRDATFLHNDILRRALQKHRGYEVVFIKDKNSGEGSFCMAFQHSTDALAWCSEVQQVLLAAFWPEELLEHPGAAEEWGDTDNRVLFKGLRVRMGVHVGTPRMVRDPMTRRMEYIGPVVNAAARITALTHGGQIVMSQATYVRVKNDLAAQGKVILGLGRFEMPDHPRGPDPLNSTLFLHFSLLTFRSSLLVGRLRTGSKLHELKITGLEGRFFGGVAIDNLDHEADKSTSTRASSNRSTISGASSAGSEVQTVVGEGMMFKEDTFLTSANLCRWIIDFAEIQVGRQVGLGSFGTVYHGRWKGVEVAVKRFIKQKLDERRMLEFRAEMAFLSELHHPNIVLFIGKRWRSQTGVGELES
jgi:class 3 adenylate cyclase